MSQTFIRQLLLAMSLMLGWVAVAGAQESAAIGTVTFQVGDTRLERGGQTTLLTKGQALKVGDRLLTGPDGHVHARMIDNGFISVRPSSRLQIQSYTYAPQDPSANRIGIMLETGVARTISGKAGEAAREHYRFNTPIAAIGLRGTDYVVQALPDVTRVSVFKGAITLSAFGPSCLINSLAPCTGPLVRELAAGSPHAYMEVRAQGGFPVIVSPENGKDAPNKVSPPRHEELSVKVAPTPPPAEVSPPVESQVTSTLAADVLRTSGNTAQAQADAKAVADAKAAADAAAAAQAKAAADAAAAAQAKAAAAAAQAKAAADAAAAAQAQAAADAAAAAQAKMAAEAAAAAQAKAAADAAAAAQAQAAAAADAAAAAQAQAAAQAAAAAQAQAAAQAAAAAQAQAAAEAAAAAQAQAAAQAAAQAQAAADAAAAAALPPARPEIAWGRWSSVALPNTPTITSLATADREITFSNLLFGLLRPAGTPQLPSAGVIAMNYAQGEAYIQATQSGAPAVLTPAALSNGKLQLDFNTRQFSTSLSAAVAGNTYALQAQGQIQFQGMLYVDASRSNMNLLGTLSNNANEAGYLFDVGVGANQTLIGATRWKR